MTHGRGSLDLCRSTSSGHLDFIGVGAGTAEVPREAFPTRCPRLRTRGGEGCARAGMVPAELSSFVGGELDHFRARRERDLGWRRRPIAPTTNEVEGTAR